MERCSVHRPGTSVKVGERLQSRYCAVLLTEKQTPQRQPTLNCIQLVR